MSTGYSAVQWSSHKRTYDAVAAAAIALYLATFAIVSTLRSAPGHATSPEITAMRALGSCAFALLTIILCIGPLARLSPRFLPILYNRRHLGVMTFFVALAHATIATGYYHGFGHLNPLVSLLATNTSFTSWRAFPFQLLGLAALLILFLMAATSHDFWLKNLSASTWKRLHMLVYPAYALLIAHIALGALQRDRGILAPALACLSLFSVVSLHLITGLRELRRDRGTPPASSPSLSPASSPDLPAGNWIDAGPPSDIPDGRARTVCAPGGERIAVFRHQDQISAVANVCAHQGGPLGEGRIIDGCITCPWHGWQYRPHDGCSPPPFTEKIPTYQVRIVRGRIFVNSGPLAPGTPVPPAPIPAPHHAHV